MKILLSILPCILLQSIFLAGCQISTGGTAIAEDRTEGRKVSDEVQIVEPWQRIDREELARLEHIATGNSREAMQSFLKGYSYGFTAEAEWYPLKHEPETWIGLQYSADGRYTGYVFSFENEIQQ